MNIYKCTFPRCKISAALDGGAKKLGTIGWEVRPRQGTDGGPLILCPVHKDNQPLFGAIEMNGRGVRK